MTKETLKKFCGKREKTGAPWTWQEYSYATDGSMVIRVPKIDGLMESDALTYGINKIFSEFKPGETYPMGLVIFEQEVCGKCSGTGRCEECRECSGDGILVLKSDFSEYEVECKSCQGDGQVGTSISSTDGANPCSYCYGTGKVDPIEMPMSQFGESQFSNKMLKKLSCFKSVTITPAGPEDPAYIKFDGGDGIIMPMRRQ